MKKKLILVGVMIAVLLGTVFAINTGYGQPAKKEPITIGVLLSLTGPMQVPGVECYNGLSIAIDGAPKEIAGRPVKWISEDDASSPAIALDKARKLIATDKVSMIVGPLHSGCVGAVLPYLETAKVPLLSVYSVTLPPGLPRNWLWLCPGPAGKTGSPLGAYAYDVLGYRTATTITNDFIGGRTYMNEFEPVFEARGGKIIQRQYFPVGTTDYSAYLLALKKADCFASWWMFGPQEVAALRQCREFGIKMPQIAPEGQSESSIVLKMDKDLATDFTAYSTTYVWTIDNPVNNKFVEAFRKKHNGDVPGGLAAAAYTSALVAIEAVKSTSGDTSGDALAKALDEIKINGPEGPFRYEEREGFSLYYMVRVEKVESGGVTVGGQQYRPKILAIYDKGRKKVGDKVIYEPFRVK